MNQPNPPFQKSCPLPLGIGLFILRDLILRGYVTLCVCVRVCVSPWACVSRGVCVSALVCVCGE